MDANAESTRNTIRQNPPQTANKKDYQMAAFLHHAFCFIRSSFSIISNLCSISSVVKPCSFTYMLRGLVRHSCVQPRIYLCSFSSEQIICLLQSGSAQFTKR